MVYIQAFLALLPIIKQLLGLFIKTPEEKQADFLNQLPAKLSEIHNAFLQQTQKRDPSAINRQLNGG